MIELVKKLDTYAKLWQVELSSYTRELLYEFITELMEDIIKNGTTIK